MKKIVYIILYILVFTLGFSTGDIIYAQTQDIKNPKILTDKLFITRTESKFETSDLAKVLPEEEMLKVKQEYSNTQEIVDQLRELNYQIRQLRKGK